MYILKQSHGAAEVVYMFLYKTDQLRRVCLKC